MLISGYAGVFYDGSPGTEFALGSGLVERMMPTAFEGAVHGPGDVVALFNHDMSLLLGRRSSGSLTLRVDDRGLHYEIKPSDTQTYRDVLAHQQAGNLLGSSLGMQVTSERMTTDGSVRVREIHSMRIRDVGPVTYPAYSGTEEIRCISSDGIYVSLREPALAEVRSLAVAQSVDAMRCAVRARAVAVETEAARRIQFGR